MKIKREAALSVLAIALLGCGGCAAPSLGRVGGDVLDLGLLAREFWDVRKPVTLGEVESPRVAVVEFSVEFTNSPAGRHDFSSSMMVELPGVLYEGFVAALPAYDRHAVPLETVSESLAYGRLQGVGLSDMPVLAESTHLTARYPVDGLLCLTGDESQSDAVIVQLLEEVDADYALQVRLRVGVRDGRASIEKGSTVRVVARDGTGLLETRLTLVSAESVTESPDRESSHAAVDSRRFVRAVQRLFRPCIGMALISTGRNV